MSARVRADIWVKIHVTADIDPALAGDEDYICDVAAQSIGRNDVLDSEVWSVDWDETARAAGEEDT